MINYLMFFISTAAFAAGKKPLPANEVVQSVNGKKLIQILPTKNVIVEMPDQEKRDFGNDYWMRLRTTLDRENAYVFYDDSVIKEGQFADAGQHVWSGKQVPAIVLDADLKAMSFVAGSRGTRMFYGFDELNPKIEITNEFPIKTRNQAATFFAPAFNAKGDMATGTLAGLDLGEGISLDVVFAFLKVKYATYRARMRLDLNFLIPVTGQRIQKKLDVSAKGYFYDVAGGYMGYSGGLELARKDAWLKSFERLVDGTQAEMNHVIQKAPLTAVVNEIADTDHGRIYYLGTGMLSSIKPGTLYSDESRTHVFEVIQSVTSGSVSILKSGDPVSVRVDMTLTEWSPESLLNVSSLTQLQEVAPEPIKIELPNKNLEKVKFNNKELDQEKKPNVFELAKLLLTVPYRVWRYFQYDQKLKTEQSIYKGEPLVAIIDSGVDYNSEALENHLWVNPQGGDSFYGWDFVSGDPRPFGDHEHGTKTAVQALSKMVDGKVMALKTHNPWGVMRSDLLVRAMKFAVEKGAKVVLTDWSTFVNASAFKQMAELAKSNDVLWVSNTGDGMSYPALLHKQFDNIVSDQNAANYSGRAAQVRATHPTWSVKQVVDFLSK